MYFVVAKPTDNQINIEKRQTTSVKLKHIKNWKSFSQDFRFFPLNP